MGWVFLSGKLKGGIIIKKWGIVYILEVFIGCGLYVKVIVICGLVITEWGFWGNLVV